MTMMHVYRRMLFSRLDGIPEPPAGFVPPLGSSRNTWTNIYKNKGRIDYCVAVCCAPRLAPLQTLLIHLLMHVPVLIHPASACA